jgi:UDP-N-acetylmuramate--alanine ligase
MSSLGHILLDYGLNVYGIDKSIGTSILSLQKKGFYFVEKLENLGNIDFAIYSTAINKQTNEFYLYFLKNNIPLYHRSEVLHSIFSLNKSISVAGSHGKTSTTTMLSQVLIECNFNPSIMIGGETSLLNGCGGRYGNGDWGVYESDESDGTFTNHHANIKIVTNIDNDHLDYYKEENILKKAFENYIYGNNLSKVIACLDDKGINDLVKLNYNRTNMSNFIFYSDKIDKEFPVFHYKINNNHLYFTYNFMEYKLSLPIHGDHFLKNAMAVILTSLELGIAPEKSIQILKNFSGVKRRMEKKGSLGNIEFLDDYGHHPTEIDAVCKAINSIKKINTRTVILFQPHRFTRTRDHYREFGKSLSQCDFIFLLPIYSSGEEPIENISSELIRSAIDCPSILLNGELEEDCKILKTFLKDGDIFLTLGAGNVYEWGEFLLKTG